MPEEIVKLTVTEHSKYREETPERFDWDLIINHREKDIACMIAAEIVTRRAAWLNEGKQGTDPLIPGLQETLRLMAARCIWKHTKVIVASPAEETTDDSHLRGSCGEEGNLQVSLEREGRVRHHGGNPEVPVAGSTGPRKVGNRPGPRDVSHRL